MAKIEIPKEGTMDWYQYQGLKKTVEEANATGGKNFTEIAKKVGMSKTWVGIRIRKWDIAHVEPKTKKATEMEIELEKACKTFLKYGITPPDTSGAVLPSAKTKKIAPEPVISAPVIGVPATSEIVSNDTAKHANNSGLAKSNGW